MAPHLTRAELDQMQQWLSRGLGAMAIQKSLTAARHRRRAPGPDLTTVRRALKSKSHKRSAPERRGRKRSLGLAEVRALDKTRKRLIRECEGRRYVQWAEVIKRTPGVKCDRCTALRAFRRHGVPVCFRVSRVNANRQRAHEQERLRTCARWRFLANDHFVKNVDMILDNKKWDVPTSDYARKYLAKQRVHGQLRTPAEGLAKHFVKPSRRKHRINPGGVVNVCAGISNGRIVLWEYVHGGWNGAQAARLYSGPILKALQRHRADRRPYVILEDNDPVGYKSRKALRAKEDNYITTMDLPRYSADLNPLDYSVWELVRERMDARAPVGAETKEEFKKRLRMTALRLSPRLVTKAVMDMKTRILAVHAAKGRDIAKD